VKLLTGEPTQQRFRACASKEKSLISQTSERLRRDSTGRGKSRKYGQQQLTAAKRAGGVLVSGRLPTQKTVEFVGGHLTAWKKEKKTRFADQRENKAPKGRI